jgi:hypothetical protein
LSPLQHRLAVAIKPVKVQMAVCIDQQL